MAATSAGDEGQYWYQQSSTSATAAAGSIHLLTFKLTEKKSVQKETPEAWEEEEGRMRCCSMGTELKVGGNKTVLQKLDQQAQCN